MVNSNRTRSLLTLHLEGVIRSIYFAFKGSKWYARPVTLRIQALI